MKLQVIRKRQGQRKRIAKRIREIRTLSAGQNKKDALFSLLQIAGNYPKIKAVK